MAAPAPPTPSEHGVGRVMWEVSLLGLHPANKPLMNLPSVTRQAQYQRVHLSTQNYKRCVKKTSRVLWIAALNTSLNYQCQFCFTEKCHKILITKKMWQKNWDTKKVVTFWVFELPYNFDIVPIWFFFSFVIIWVFMLGHIFSFELVPIWVFEFCDNLCFRVLSQFKLLSLSQFGFLNFVTIWVSEFDHNLIFFYFFYSLSFLVLSQELFSFVTIWVFKFCHNLSFCVSALFEFFSFVTIWFFSVLSQIEFFRLVTIWVFQFCHNLSFWVLSQFEF